MMNPRMIETFLASGEGNSIDVENFLLLDADYEVFRSRLAPVVTFVPEAGVGGNFPYPDSVLRYINEFGGETTEEIPEAPEAEQYYTRSIPPDMTPLPREGVIRLAKMIDSCKAALISIKKGLSCRRNDAAGPSFPGPGTVRPPSTPMTGGRHSETRDPLIPETGPRSSSVAADVLSGSGVQYQRPHMTQPPFTPFTPSMPYGMGMPGYDDRAWQWSQFQEPQRSHYQPSPWAAGGTSSHPYPAPSLGAFSSLFADLPGSQSGHYPSQPYTPHISSSIRIEEVNSDEEGGAS